MGCDIHLRVEVRKNGAWESADSWREEEDHNSVHYDASFYSDRNYYLFAILAGVRDYDGTFVPIDVPRGLPNDVCGLIRQDSRWWDADSHSQSWFTLREILDYDWTQVATLSGVVNAATYWEWSKFEEGTGESPKTYCAGVGGGGTEIVDLTEMERRIAQCLEHSEGKFHEQRETLTEQLRRVYCYVTWEQPYYKCCRDFWSDCIPRLLRLGDPEDVRIVFWFDN